MRGNITRRGKSSWQLKFDVASDSGKRQQRYATVRGTYKDAQRELTRLISAADAGTLTDLSKVTVGEYVRRWIAGAQGRTPKTLERYGELCERQIIPHLGAIQLQKLRPEHVQQWHGTLLSGDKPLARWTVIHAHRLLSLALSDAMKNGTVARNVATVHKPPMPDQEEVVILTPEQIDEVLCKLAGHFLYPIASLAIDTGMRRGELCGLQWGDVDLDGATLQVERAVEETRQGLRVKGPKSKRGRRSIALPKRAVTMLRAHRVEQLERRLILGQGKITDTTLVFSNVEGNMLWPDDLTRIWARVVLAKKLPRVTFHALRHTHASVLINAGLDVLTISRRLGHSKPSVTLDVYGHLIKGADAVAADAIDALLGQ
jgi:integrase